MTQIKVGVIVNTHGLKGELKIKPMTHFIEERFAKNSRLYVVCQNEETEVVVHTARMQKDMVLASFQGLLDINMVEKWKGCYLCVHREELNELDEDEVYYHDLMGCEVMTTDHEYLGKVTELIETGANLIIRVEKDDQEFLLPYVKEFIKEADMDHKTLTVELIEGFL